MTHEGRLIAFSLFTAVKGKNRNGNGCGLVFLFRAKVFTRPMRFLSIQNVTSERARMPLILLPRGDGDALGIACLLMRELVAG